MRKTIIIAWALTLCLMPVANAQPPSSPDLTGTWKASIIIASLGWEEKATNRDVFSLTIYLEHLESSLDPREYNLLWRPDEIDTFQGYTHGNRFAFYKENLDNCGGPAVNLGREMIVGTVNQKGTRMFGEGMGFDSNPDCGGTWTYIFSARKTSDELPF
jgi:hypothetical protein